MEQIITEQELESLDFAICLLLKEWIYSDSFGQRKIDVVEDLKSIREKIQFLNRNKHTHQEVKFKK